MQSLCVFCGSQMGKKRIFQEKTIALGHLLAEKDIQLVYGGGKVGLMGLLADSVLEKGGKVIGIIPESLYEREVGHNGVTQLHIVKSMHERKSMMEKLSDAFIALPGGLGTLEEFCEILTWGQLGIHKKPCGILNIDGFYQYLLDLFSEMNMDGFLPAEYLSLFQVKDEPLDLLNALKSHTPPMIEKWMDKSKT
ncbi:MAG: TIGR00730 family Rossman fold protein [Planctomycetota bacterium]|nr:MAG: TIGR00730 family Rossman fold protein [Planctomycetota bacterium]